MYRFLIILMAFSMVAFASGEPAKQSRAENTALGPTLVIDTFDDGDITNTPTWWVFDRLQPVCKEASDPKYGTYYLQLTGKAEKYYVGGMGTYVGKDISDMNTLVVSVYGTGKNSGTLKIQLYDDDNNTYQLEQDSTFKPLHDDIFEYELPVTWDGWRTIEVPLNRFVDVNPGVGDDQLNADQLNGSGGLLHLQLIVLSPQEKGSVSMGLDAIRFEKKDIID